MPEPIPADLGPRPEPHVARRVLVTGGAGFVGSCLAHQLLATTGDEAPERVVVLDLLTYAGSRANLRGLEGHPASSLVVGDVADAALVDALIGDERIDTVVHLAAESHVDRSIDGPLPFVRTNVLGTATLLEVCGRRWGRDPGKRFHHVSTDEVYGDLAADDPPFTEESPYRPSSPYAASKAGSDHLVRAWARTYGLPVTITSGSNTYGPRQHPEKLIPRTIQRCLERAPIPVYGTGQNVRDWLYVDDHCAGIRRVVRDGWPGATYNVGGGDEWRNLDLVRRICRTVADLTGDDVERLLASITFVADRPGHDRRYALATARARGLGWAPEVDLDLGLVRTVSWYLERGFAS